MLISAFSDTHGKTLPRIDPAADLIIIAGDLLPDGLVTHQWWWMDTVFRNWLDSTDKKVIMTPGNHDFLFSSSLGYPKHPRLTVLIDKAVTFHGIKIYGTPWIPQFFNWAFMDSEDGLQKRFSKIPNNTDILISHGPPLGYGDTSPFSRTHVGSFALTEAITKTKPTVLINGHVHSGHGEYHTGHSTIYNVALTDESYNIVNKPTDIEI